MRSGDCRSGRVRPQWWLVAAVCLMAGLLPVTSAGAADEPADAGESSSDTEDPAGGVQVVRYAGSDQYAMSIEMAQALVDAEGGTSEWVVLASGESWADAAMAGPLAASLSAPVVLVPSGGLQALSARIEFAQLLRSAGVRRVMIVGSGIALPNHKQSVLYGLGMLPRDVERLHGTDPVAISIAVAERIGTPAELGELDRTVVIASDRSVADAVAVGPLAAAGPFPLLLTAPDVLDPRITAYLTDQEVAHVVLVGGTAAIAPAVQHAIESAGATVTRLAGRDRSDTARLAADLFDRYTADNPACTAGLTRIGLAPAQQPEQALTAGPLLAQTCTSLRYTESDQLPADLSNTLYLASHRPEGARIVAFADDETIPDSQMEPSVPPVRMAFEGGWPPGHPRHGEFAVVVLDERGRWHRYPVESDHSPGFDAHGWGSEVFEWSPDGRYLAYISARDHQLLVIDTEEGEILKSESEGVRLRFSRWDVPKWSPGSSLLAFSAFPEGVRYAEVFIYDTEARSTIRLTENETSEDVVAWSPDSAAVALEQSEIDEGFFSLVRYSSHLAVLNVETGAMARLHQSRFFGIAVVWAPDGTHLAFSGSAENSPDEQHSRGYLVRGDGSGLQQLASADGFVSVNGFDETGGRILYSKNYSASHMPSQRWIRDLDTGEDSPLGFTPYQPHFVLGWSLDQRAILFRLVGVAGELDSLVRVDVETGEVQRLMEFQMPGQEQSSLGLSGDQQQLAFVIDKDRLLVVMPMDVVDGDGDHRFLGRGPHRQQ